MKRYVDCYNTMMNIGFKLAESGDELQVAMGNEIVNAMEDLDNVIENRLERKRIEALDQISNVLCDHFSTENI